MGLLVEVSSSVLTSTYDLTIYDLADEASAEKSCNDNLKFMVANSLYEDAAYVMFKKGYGLNKISHRNPDVPMVYVNHNGEDFAIATVDDNTKLLGLSVKAKTMGKYTLRYKADGHFSYMHLIDRLTGDDVDLLLDNEYAFMASPTDNPARFIVRLEYSENPENIVNSVFAYQNGNDIIVSGEGELQVFDLMGRMVMTQYINGVETCHGTSLQTGVYIFRLNENVQKIVVK